MLAHYGLVVMRSPHLARRRPGLAALLNLLRIVPKTLMLMQTRFGAELGQLHVSIGPSAGVCCYEVGEPVLNEVRNRFAWWETVLRDQRQGKARLDLKTLIRRQVQDCGI